MGPGVRREQRDSVREAPPVLRLQALVIGRAVIGGERQQIGDTLPGPSTSRRISPLARGADIADRHRVVRADRMFDRNIPLSH